MGACQGVAEGFEQALVRRMGSEVLSPSTLAAEVDAVVAFAAVDAEEACCQAVGSVVAAAAAAACGREAAHSAVADRLVAEGSAVAVAAAAAEQEAMRVVEDRIGRLAEAQSTAADPDVGLLRVSGGSRWLLRITYHIHLSPVGLRLISQCCLKTRTLLTRVEITTWWWGAAVT